MAKRAVTKTGRAFVSPSTIDASPNRIGFPATGSSSRISPVPVARPMVAPVAPDSVSRTVSSASAVVSGTTSTDTAFATWPGRNVSVFGASTL